MTKLHQLWPVSPAKWGLLVIMVVYNAFFVAYSLQKHAAYQTAGFDLGVWDQMVWNTLHGRPFWLTLHNDITNGLGDHVELILLLMPAFYGLRNGPETLLVLQTLLVSLGAIPIYWLAQERLGSEMAGLVFALVYLLFPALQAAITFDIHSLTLAVPLLAYTLWAMYTQRYKIFAVGAALTLTCKEDMALLILMMGLYILFIQHQKKIGMLTIGVSLAWFLTAVYAIIPLFRPEGGNEYIYRYAEWGNSTTEIFINIVTQPWRVLQVITAGDKLLYWLRLTMPVMFMALLDPLTLLLAAPTLLINTLGNYPAAYQLDLFHNSGPLAVYVTIAGILGTARLLRFAAPKFRHIRVEFLRGVLLTGILLVTFVYQIQFGHTPVGRFFSWPMVTPRHRNIGNVLAFIPHQAAVAAQNNLVPRLSHRLWIFVLPDIAHGSVAADYVVMDLQGNFDLHQSLLKYCTQLNQFVADPGYGLIFAQDGLLLFQRGAPDTVTYQPQPPCP